MVFALELFDQEGRLIFGSDTEILDRPFDAPVGAGRADLSFERVPLLDGAYSVKVESQGPVWGSSTTARSSRASR